MKHVEVPSCKRCLPGIAATLTVGLLIVAGWGCSDSSDVVTTTGLPSGQASLTQVERGRAIVVTSGCTDCHNRGKDDPRDVNWMAGFIAGTPGQPFQIGPFSTYPANLTPNANNGLGNFTDRQIYNALKYGLDPEDTPDVVITSTTPGQGNFPATPHYLAPPMPWPATRHLPDADIWALVAYLKHGIKAVNNAVPDSQGPPDFWASAYTEGAVGPATLPDYPASNEQYSP